MIAIHGGTDSMQNVPWYMDLVGAGFTNHGSNQGGILIDTESGGHVELVNADPGSTATAGMPDRFFTVDELYNTNRDVVSTGIAHPLVYENEDSLVGQLGYGTGALMNTDQHAMVWCRNFDGGRSFTTTLNHSWQFNTAAWFQQQMLAAVQWTAGVGYVNCVTFYEVRNLIAVRPRGREDHPGRRGRAEREARRGRGGEGSGPDPALARHPRPVREHREEALDQWPHRRRPARTRVSRTRARSSPSRAAS